MYKKCFLLLVNYEGHTFLPLYSTFCAIKETSELLSLSKCFFCSSTAKIGGLVESVTSLCIIKYFRVTGYMWNHHVVETPL